MKLTSITLTIAIAGAIASVSEATYQPRCYDPMPDTDLYGDDFKVKFGLPMSDCYNACIANENCVAFTYANSNCYLKQGHGRRQWKQGAISVMCEHPKSPSAQSQKEADQPFQQQMNERQYHQQQPQQQQQLQQQHAQQQIYQGQFQLQSANQQQQQQQDQQQQTQNDQDDQNRPQNLRQENPQDQTQQQQQQPDIQAMPAWVHDPRRRSCRWYEVFGC